MTRVIFTVLKVAVKFSIVWISTSGNRGRGRQRERAREREGVCVCVNMLGGAVLR